MYYTYQHLSTLTALDDFGRQNDVFSYLIPFPIPVFHAGSDSDRVEAELGQKWLQIDDFRFSLQKCVFLGRSSYLVLGDPARGPSWLAGQQASWPATSQQAGFFSETFF